MLAGLREGSLVSVCVPCGPAGKRWLAWLMEAIRHQARGQGEPLPLEAPALSGSIANPLAELASSGSLSRLRNIDDLLEYHPDDGALVLVVECEQTLSPQWKSFFDTIRRVCRGAGSRRLRPVLSIIIGSREYPPITHDVGTRVFALWNTVRWEELRLLADATLPRDENALTRAWRVATYAGAANGDPDILVRLCHESPNSLDQVVELALNRASPAAEFGYAAVALPDRRWSVPPSAVEHWAAGHLLGYTPERGLIRATSGMSRETGGRYLRAAIWREQLTALFPVVVELGFEAAAAITSAMGSSWQQAIPIERRVSDSDPRLDPKEIMEIFSTGRFGRVPQSIWSFLSVLRRTRNDVAHMSPLELQRMRQIWQGYDLICVRFRNAK